MTIKYIGDGGSGSEARIIIELRTEFPGIGGNIETYQAIPVARREEYNQSPKKGHILFLRHTLIKKFEDFFFEKKIYNFAHVPRPMGSDDNWYMYEWAYGTEYFPWTYIDKDTLQGVPVWLDDWNEFINAYNSVGINFLRDCTDPDDGRISKNIIHQLYNTTKDYENLNQMWKRIDYGYASIGIDYQQLEDYLKDNKINLITHLRLERYSLMELALRYLYKKEGMTTEDIELLELYTFKYRTSTLSHLNTKGFDKKDFDRSIECTGGGSCL